MKRYSEFINFPIYIWGSKEIDVDVPADEDESNDEEAPRMYYCLGCRICIYNYGKKTVTLSWCKSDYVFCLEKQPKAQKRKMMQKRVKMMMLRSQRQRKSKKQFMNGSF